MPEKKKTNYLGDKIRSFDMFGMDQTFNIAGQDKIRTTCGAIMSFILTAILLTYGAYRAIEMINIDDTFVQRVTRIGYYDETDIFTQEQLNFYISYSWDYQAPGTYDRYVNVSFVHKTFEPDTWTTYEVVPDRVCTESDIENHFPLADPKNTFSRESWNCPDIDPDVNLYGDFNAWSSSYFEIWVEYCNNATSSVQCASKEEIDEYLTLTYLIVRMNTQTFSELSMDDHIVGTTKEDWISVNPNAHMRLNYQIEYQEIEREDSFIQIGQYEKDFFTSTKLGSQLPVIAYENHDTMMQVVLQMNFDSSIYRRQIYGVLEWFGDLGGVLEAFSIIFGCLTVTWAQVNLEKALTEALYKVKPQMGPSEEQFAQEQRKKFSQRNLQGLKSQMAGRKPVEINTQYLISTCCWRLICCDHKDRILRRGFARVEREMDLITFIKEKRENLVIKKVRMDKFDQIFGKEQASNVIDLNFPTSSSGGEGQSPDDHRIQFKEMKKLIKTREALTSMDMKLLQGVLLDQTKNIPWDEGDSKEPNNSSEQEIHDPKQLKKKTYTVDEPIDDLVTPVQGEPIKMNPEQKKAAQQHENDETKKRMQMLYDPQESNQRIDTSRGLTKPNEQND